MDIHNIANEIFDRIKKENIKKVRLPALGRGDIKDRGNEIVVWIVRSIPMSSVLVKDIKDNILGTQMGPLQYLEEGLVISRDGRLAGFIITDGIGKVLIPSPLGNRKVDVLSSASYIPVVVQQDATYGTIKTRGAQLRFKSLREELRLRGEIAILNSKLEETKIEEEARILRKEIDEKTVKLKKLQRRITERIISSSTLREQPILDKYQERIKRSKILEGGLIINGGPGTGKTTSLIQRITFLTSKSILEYRDNLTTDDKELLFDQEKNWIFFSPSELLREYLRNAMTGEGLQAEKERVRVWDVHRSRLFKEFGFIKADKDKPFVTAESNNILLKSDGQTTLELLSSIDNYFIQQQISKLNKIKELNLLGFSWIAIGKAIQNKLKEFLETSHSIEEFILLFDNLNVNYSEQGKSIFNQYNNDLSLEISQIIARVERQDEIKKWFEGLLLSLKAQKQYIDDVDVETDDGEIEDEESWIEIEAFDFRIEFDHRLASWLRKYGLSEIDSSTKLTAQDKDIRQRLTPFISEKAIRKIGENAYFKKYFGKIIGGIEKNILAEIPTIYKKYRREILEDSHFVIESEKNYLSDLISRRNNRIYKDEMDIILLQTFRLIYAFFKSRPRVYKESSFPYINAYNLSAKAVVAIDEATDFSPIQLMCMSYLAHPRFKCVTLSGDLMQTMTSIGLKSWDDYCSLFPNTTIENMSISYRQTPRLMTLAKLMYENSTGLPATFSSIFEEDENDPAPLLLVSPDLKLKCEWIADRIIEIHKIYSGNIPSIAIFLRNEKEVDRYFEQLDMNNKLIKYDIKVAACKDGKVLGDVENVRLFSLQYIKGMEFQAVFFVDIDSLESNEQALLNKYIYVGLSRASFFLGVTVNTILPQQISYLLPYFKDGGWQ